VDFPEDRVLNVTPRRLLDFLEMRSGRRIAELADFSFTLPQGNLTHE